MEGDPQVHEASPLAAEVWDRAGEEVRPEASSFCCLSNRQVSRYRWAQMLKHAPNTIHKILSLYE